MRNFWRDYGEYQRNRNEICKVWYKKHWKGTMVMHTILWIVTFALVFRDKIPKLIEWIIYGKENKENEA